ncbi:MAG: Asp-tRNA(Asn)/Glu-tRNA(Gln) amidotransferase subunit GatB, partial [Pyrinomonadaceae bacterium]
TSDRALADYFERAAGAAANPRAASNWIRSELLRELEAAGVSVSDSPIAAEELGALVRLIDEGKISGKQGKEVLVEMFASGKGAAVVVEERGLAQVSDTGEIERIISEVVAASPQQLAQYRAGKEALFGFFVGQVMKASKGKANPKLVNELLKAKLSDG